MLTGQVAPAQHCRGREGGREGGRGEQNGASSSEDAESAMYQPLFHHAQQSNKEVDDL